MLGKEEKRSRLKNTGKEGFLAFRPENRSLDIEIVNYEPQLASWNPEISKQFLPQNLRCSVSSLQC